jgi:hypothetical protein
MLRSSGANRENVNSRLTPALPDVPSPEAAYTTVIVLVNMNVNVNEIDACNV